MELHQIRYFLALCELRSFTAAAHHCAVSQPSISNAVRSLENELGGALFRRKPEVRLTRLGELVRGHFARISRELERLNDRMRPRAAAAGQTVAARAVRASALMRSTMERKPLERCGVKCSRRPSRSNRAMASVAKTSRAVRPE
jgi:DNA-binding transcriptional LysR family regulator